VAITLNIKVFENLILFRIKHVWCDSINEYRHPKDYDTVIKNVTRHHVVEEKELYRRLGYINEKSKWTLSWCLHGLIQIYGTVTMFTSRISGMDMRWWPKLAIDRQPNADEDGQLNGWGIYT